MTPDDLLEHAGFVRALARSLVKNDEGAADLEQDTWLQGLQHPPRDASAPKSWLRTVAQRLEFNRRRSAARLKKRELNAAKPEAGPASPSHRAAVVREVMEEVLRLPEDLSEVVILRFFEDLPPKELSERLRIPVGTVRSRLHRALEILRSSLDRKHDGDRSLWAAPLSAFWKAGDPALSVTLASKAAGSSTRKGIQALIAASVLGVALVLSFRIFLYEEPPRPGVPPKKGVLNGIGATGSEVAQGPSAIRTTPSPKEDLPDTVPARGVKLIGRVVEKESGKAIPGARISVKTTPFRMEIQPGLGGLIEQVTGTDGSFEVLLQGRTSDPVVVDMTVDSEGRAKASAHFVAKEVLRDLGTVELSLGSEVRVRVLDKDGAPLPSIPCLLTGPSQSFGLVGTGNPQTLFLRSSDSDVRGSGSLLTPGTWKVSCHSRGISVQSGGEFEVRAGGEALITEVRLSASASQTIAGVMVDEESVAVRRVSVQARGANGEFHGGTELDDEGAFCIVFPSDVQGEVQLSGDGEGVEPMSAPKTATVGMQGCRLVVRRSGRAIIRLNGSGAEASEECGALVFMDRREANWKETRHHALPPKVLPDRRLEINDLIRGRWVAILYPFGDDPSPLHPVRLTIPESGLVEAVAEIPDRRKVSVRVVDERGKGIPGAEVEFLCPLLEPKLSIKSLAVEPNRRGSPPIFAGGSALVLAKGQTDAEGRAGFLLLPPGEGNGVRVSAPGFARSLTLLGSSFDSSGETQIVLRRETKLVGVAGPPELIQQLSKNVPPEELFGEVPKVRIEFRRSDSVKAGVQSIYSATLGQDGSFEMDGVLPGMYWAFLRFSASLARVGSRQAWTVKVDGPSFEISEGSEPLALDFSKLRPSPVRGVARLDGHVIGQGCLIFWRLPAGEEDPSLALPFGPNVPLNPDGTFEASVPSGTYVAHLRLPGETVWTARVFRSSSNLRVASDGAEARDLEFHSRSASLLVVDESSGNTLRGFQLWIEMQDSTLRHVLSDENGRIEIEKEVAAPLNVYVVPQKLRGDKFLRETPIPPWDLKGLHESVKASIVRRGPIPIEANAPRLQVTVRVPGP